MRTWILAVVALAVVGGCRTGDVGGAVEVPRDVAADLLEVVLKAHEEATGTTRPNRIRYVGLGGENIADEIIDGVRQRMAAASDGATPWDGDGWQVVVFPLSSPNMVSVHVHTDPEAWKWPKYDVEVHHSTSGVEIGEVVFTAEVIRRMSTR